MAKRKKKQKGRESNLERILKKVENQEKTVLDHHRSHLLINMIGKVYFINPTRTIEGVKIDLEDVTNNLIVCKFVSDKQSSFTDKDIKILKNYFHSLTVSRKLLSPNPEMKPNRLDYAIIIGEFLGGIPFRKFCSTFHKDNIKEVAQDCLDLSQRLIHPISQIQDNEIEAFSYDCLFHGMISLENIRDGNAEAPNRRSLEKKKRLSERYNVDPSLIDIAHELITKRIGELEQI